MDAIDTLITKILKREGGYVNHPSDKGGRTKFGITERDFPGAWKDGDVSEDEARAIYRQKFVVGPGFDKIAYPPLMEQLVDFGVNSGPGMAIQKLQLIIGAKQDGVLGPNTLRELAWRDQREVNNLLVGERCKMFARICIRDKSQLAFLLGWINRATEFLL